MPWHDWQFWVVTAAAIAAGAWLARGAWRKLSPRGRARANERRATLTVSAKGPAGRGPSPDA